MTKRSWFTSPLTRPAKDASGGIPIIPIACDAMYSGKDWLRIDHITESAIHLVTGRLSVPNIQLRAALIHGDAADEQRRLRPEHQQAQAHAPFYDWIGELLCKA